MQTTPTLARYLELPENRGGLVAIRSIIAAFQSRASQSLVSPLLLHGPSGSGKTLLAAVLSNELLHFDVQLSLVLLSANDWRLLHEPSPSVATESGADSMSAMPIWLRDAYAADFLVIEDLQHLPERAAEALTLLLDDRQAHQLPTLVTSRFGPRQLAQRAPRPPARLMARLAAGLVVCLERLQPESRLRLLQELAQRRQLAIAPEILPWLAAHLAGGGRQLEGAVAQLDTLAKLQRQPLRLADIRAHFRAQVDALRPSLERIVEQVGGHFGIEKVDLCSRRRLRSILLPRQISMYLARRLTRLTMKHIGASLGGHDHSTVLHACRKIENSLTHDALLAGAVRQLQAQLT